MEGGPRGRTIGQRVLLVVETAFSLWARSRPVPASRGTFLVAVHPHRGGPVTLPDGTLVRSRDRIVEIHFWNRRIAARREGRAESVTWSFARDFRADLGALARALGAGHFGPGIQAVYGASPLAWAARRFGFTVRPLPPGPRRWVLTAWQLTVRRVFRPRVMSARLSASAAELWMSTADLCRRYDPR